MTVIAMALALAALIYAFLIQRKFQNVTRRLARTNSHLYELSAQYDGLEEKLEAQSKQLSYQIKLSSGQIDIGPNTTIAEIRAVHPDADRIFSSFHMGGCHSCAVEPDESIAAACKRLDVNEAALLATLRNGAGEPLPVANIELQF